MKEFLIRTLLTLPALFIALGIHESAHGYMAYKMGDSTAKQSGRLSLNPKAHFDPIGALCLLLFHFGWAKPVPINPRNFKNQKLGIILVSLAGPFANFVVAFLSALVYGLLIKYLGYPMGGLTSLRGIQILIPMVQYCILLNIGLMIFNLIPIPPLDGSKVLMEFLPYKARRTMYELERYSFLILILLMNTSIFQSILGYLNMAMIDFFNVILNLIF